jgi:eukaryotic-like serine/threonine-protein kinase
MLCPACKHVNPEGARFCNACGSELTAGCIECGGTNPPGARFCSSCGTSLAPKTDVTEAAATITAESADEPRKASEPEQPEAFAGGRYRVKRFLGEGGKKKVYLVTDSLLERDVAFSLIKTEGLDETGVERIKREAQVMGRLGDHPHMVALYDIGEENEQPYLVSQLMRGGDVEGLIDDAPGHRVPLQQTLQIADQVCQALEYAHSHGIIHRDLKPGNVWLTGDGTAKLGDFGLAIALDRTRLSTAGTIVGTVAYMPPEQAMGRESDACSDLYSLGAMLYEMVTGKQPFVGDDPVAVISQHLNTKPVAPSWHNPDVPKPLERLILRLLSKDPEARPESAAAVREELSSVQQFIEQTQGGSISETISDEIPRNPLDRLAGGVFVGREQELEQLRHAVDAAFSGNGQVVLVSGEPGIGKTTLVEELSTYARMRGAQVRWSRNYEVSGRPPYWAWVQLIRDYVHDRNPEELRSELGSGASVIAQVVSEIRKALPDLPPGPELSSEHARFQLFDGIATFLKNASRNQPLVLSLDDLHWADGPSLKLLEHVVQEMRGSRLLIIGTYRDVEVGRHHPLAATLAELSRQHGVHRITLRGLSNEEVGRYIELTAGRAASEDLVASIHRQTEGNPFFVAEIVRLLVAEGKFEELRSARWSITLPQGVREVIGRRLDGLSEECNRVLSAAAVVGREFDLELLAAMQERDADEVLELLDEALQARVVRESDKLDHYRFAQEIIQETLYEELSITQRRRWNGRAARAIEELHGDNLTAYYAQLAHHYAAAGPREDAGKAIDYARKAGERAMEQGAWEVAIRHYETAYSILDVQPVEDPVLRCEVLLGLGEAHNRSGAMHPSNVSLPEPPSGPVVGAGSSFIGYTACWAAAEIARNHHLPHHLARAALGLVGHNVFSNRGPAVVNLIEEALESLPHLEPRLRARLLARQSRLIVGCMALRWMDPDDVWVRRSDQYIDEAMRQARELGDPQILSEVLRSSFAHSLNRSPFATNDQLLTELAEIGRELSDPRTQAMGWTARNQLALRRGDRKAVLEGIRAMEQIASDWGMTYEAWLSKHQEIGIALQCGDFRKAEKLIGEARALQPGGLNVLQQEWRVRWERDQRQELLASVAAMESLVQRAGLANLLDPLVLMARWDSGDRESVRQQLDNDGLAEFLAFPPFGGARWFSWFAELCHLVDFKGGAQQIYALLLEAEESIVSANSDLTGGATACYLGLLATTLEDYDKAEEHFGEALRLNTEWGFRPYVGHTQYAWADMLIRRGNPDDRERALELVDQALQLAEELGMFRLERQALSLKVQIQGILKA